jgi:hypothetical protein
LRRTVFPRFHLRWLQRVVRQVIVRRHVLRRKSVFPKLHRRWLECVVRQVILRGRVLKRKEGAGSEFDTAGQQCSMV